MLSLKWDIYMNSHPKVWSGKKGCRVLPVFIKVICKMQKNGQVMTSKKAAMLPYKWLVTRVHESEAGTSMWRCCGGGTLKKWSLAGGS